MTTTHDILYTVGDSVQWDGYDYIRDEYDDIVGITDGTVSLYVDVVGEDCDWTIRVADSDGVADIVDDGTIATETAADYLTEQWVRYTGEDWS
mgnify:CR=1 FL=1